jgi:EpsI family protein
MKKSRVQALVAALLMALAVVCAYQWKPRQFLADQRGRLDLTQAFPASFGDWIVDPHGQLMLIAPDMQAELNKIYNQTLSRTYINRKNGARIMLSVAYGGDQSDATRAHRPEVCYPAQGFRIVSNSEAQVNAGSRGVPVRHLVARMGGRNEPITYWLTTGDLLSISGTQQKLNQLSFTTRGVVPDGMLVRVSNIGSDDDAGFAAHAQFLNDLATAVPVAYQERIFGTQPARRG